MTCKRSSFCSVAVLKAGAWLCTAWAFLNQHMDYNILFVLSLMSWEKVLLQSIWKLAQIHSSCFFLDCSICLKLFTCLLMVIPAHPQAVSSPNIVLHDWKNPRSSSLFGTWLTISAKSRLKCHGPVCHRRSQACWGCPSGHFSDFCVCTATKTHLECFSNPFFPSLWSCCEEAVTEGILVKLLLTLNMECAASSGLHRGPVFGVCFLYWGSLLDDVWKLL